MTFDGRMKIRAQREDCPLPEGFDDRLRARVDACLAEPEKERKPMKKRVFRTVLLAAALCGLLCAGAFALSPTLREALAAALGSFAPYSQTVEGVSATDQGIEIKVLSALMDEGDGTAYLAVTDLTGDRLGEDMRLKLNVSGRWLAPIAYDEATKTALFTLDLDIPIYEIYMGREEELVITCESILTGRVELPAEEVLQLMDGTEYVWERGTDIPKHFYTNQTLKSRPLTEKEKEGQGTNNQAVPVLLPDQTPADLGSSYFSLSSLGFDENGVFHVQLALAEGYYLANAYGLDLDLIPGFWPEDLGLAQGLSRRCILLEDGRYVDISFKDIGPEDIDKLPAATVTGAVYAQPPIQGEWRLSFPYVIQPAQEVTLEQPFCWEGIDLTGADLTAMSFRLTYTGGDTHSIFMGGQPLHLFCRDGSVLKLKFGDQILLYRNEAGEEATNYELTYEQKMLGDGGWRYFAEQDSWSYPRAVAPKDVVGFSWGQWYVPLDGSDGGHWLSEVPKATE